MKKIAILTGAVLLLATTVIAQTDSTMQLSLIQAKEYALQNSPVMKNARLDIENAKRKIWETTAIGLPQVNSKLSYSYMITLSSTIEQFNSFSSIGNSFGDLYGMVGMLAGQAGNVQVLNMLDSISNASAGSGEESTVSTDDLRWGLTWDITATQLIFSGAYLVGLQTSKTFSNLTEIALTQSELDLKQNVASAYYLVLIAEENFRVIDSTCQSTEKLLNDLKAMNKSGFIEETDVDQLRLTLSNLQNTRALLERQIGIAYNLLKYQLGIDFGTKLVLTDKIEALAGEQEIAGLALQSYSYENNPQYQMLETQEKLSKLNVNFNKSTYLPDIAAFYQHQENFNDKAFSFTPPDMIGVAMNIPIFGSGMKRAKVQQAKIQLEKVRNSKEQAAGGLTLDYEQSRANLLNALDKTKTNRENMFLAKRIYGRTLIKYQEGLSSSLDLTQTQNQYLMAQSNYYSALIELLNARAKMEKLLNQ
jgi:outer membrane protein TolC